jgi:antirestriction protein
MMTQDLYNIIVGVAGAAVGWMLKVVWESVRALQADMKEIERELHTEYVSKNDYRQDIVEMKDILKQIFDKLDRKVDK